MSEIGRLAWQQPRQFALALLCGIAAALAAVALLAVSGWLIVTASLVDTLVALSVAVVGVRFFAVSRATFRYLERLLGHQAALKQLGIVRGQVVRGLIPFAPAGLGETHRGQLLATLVDDVDNLQNLPLRVVQPIAIGLVTALVAVGCIAVIAPAAAAVLALCLLISVAVASGLAWVFGAQSETRIVALRGELSAALTDYLGSFDTLVAYNAEADARARVRQADAVLRRAVSRAALVQALTAAVVTVCSGLASVGALASTVGVDLAVPLIAVVALTPMAVFEVFVAVPQAASSWRSVRASTARIRRVLAAELPREVRDDEGTVSKLPQDSPAVPHLRLRAVSARWPGGTSALTSVDLDVAAGERVLVTGPSGAGKSSLAAVLVGFLRYGGDYSLNGVAASRFTGPALRSIIGLCEQRSWLFDESIRQNLIFARDTASDEALFEVLDRVGLADWARERGGLDARVGERGSLISGGQAQRIALARALLHDFPVLVLDEPTAGVDVEAAEKLLNDLLGAVGNRSLVLISHAVPPSVMLDRVVHLEHGRTVALPGGVHGR